MNDINKTIKHFESLQKRYTTQHNGQMCERVADALEALYQCKSQQDYFDRMFGTNQSKSLLTNTVTRIATIEEDIFTPEQVRKMTREEVKANYAKILESMKYWN
jgi:hypothetical protein